MQHPRLVQFSEEDNGHKIRAALRGRGGQVVRADRANRQTLFRQDHRAGQEDPAFLPVHPFLAVPGVPVVQVALVILVVLVVLHLLFSQVRRAGPYRQANQVVLVVPVDQAVRGVPGSHLFLVLLVHPEHQVVLSDLVVLVGLVAQVDTFGKAASVVVRAIRHRLSQGGRDSQAFQEPLVSHLFLAALAALAAQLDNCNSFRLDGLLEHLVPRR